MTPDDVDLARLDTFAGGPPWAMFDMLRRNAPVFWNARSGHAGFWALTRHADIRRVSEDHTRFEPDPPAGRGELCPPDLTPATLARYEALLHELAAATLDAALPAGRFDFAAEVSAQFPARVLARLLGVAPAGVGRLVTWADQLAGHPDPPVAAAAEVAQRYPQLPASRQWLVAHLAGSQVTRHTLSAAALALAAHPDQFARLRARPELIPTAVEEFLRWASPRYQVRRTALRYANVGGTAVRPGEQVVLWLAAANRDPQAFADPDRLDLTRSPNEHLGLEPDRPHAAPAAALTRMQLTVMIAELLPRLAGLEITGPVGYLRSNVVNGIASLPVRVEQLPISRSCDPAATG